MTRIRRRGGAGLAVLGWARVAPVWAYIPNSLLSGFGVLGVIATVIAGLEAEIEVKLLLILGCLAGPHGTGSGS
jgi:hypothetical protein